MTRGDGAAQPLQGSVREEARHEARLHGLLREGLRAGARRTCRRSTPRSTARDLIYKNYYHIGVAVGTDKGLVVPVVRDCDHKSLAEIEKDIADFGKQRARRSAQDRRDAGRHVHDLERRRLRLAAVDADPQRAAVRHPRHAQDPGAPGGDRRQDRDPPDDVSGAVLRSPPDRRPRGRDLPRAREGSARRPGADVLDL